ncbi:AP2-like ethylene-responsive transcription factor At2g41710 isoform X1 [Aristolochia californica]|uniref:AP2-like ethylene-responsive transcription factor At2g41710 isoform X1 n=1 Tax=Aristolochia californica TaxID=171875 RepID=UPI0035D7DD21
MFGMWIATVYLGAYDDEEAAARAYDLAALKYWGPGTLINFPVSDYSRDLEEMQMVSREDYLASLRRKSSGFSRGLSKYRGLSRPPQSSGWETSFSRMLGNEYFNSLTCSTSDDPAAENEFVGGFCLERKIDVTNYIQWWGPRRPRHAHGKNAEGTHDFAEDAGVELKALEWSIQHTVPYQFPSLGLANKKKSFSSAMSACSVLSQSTAFKHLEEKILNNQEDKGAKKMICSGRTEGSGVALRLNDVQLQKMPYPLTPLVTAPLLTSSNAIDQPLPDPIFWTSLVPSSGLSVSTTMRLAEVGTPSSTAVWKRAA